MTVERPKEELQHRLVEHGYHYVMQLSEFGESLWVHQSLGLSSAEVRAIAQEAQRQGLDPLDLACKVGSCECSWARKDFCTHAQDDGSPCFAGCCCKIWAKGMAETPTADKQLAIKKAVPLGNLWSVMKGHPDWFKK